MLNSPTNCFIFDFCMTMFPELESGLKLIQGTEQEFNLVATCENENDLKLTKVGYEPLKGQFKVRLFIEFMLNGEVRKHPNFLLGLDFVTKRAEVLSFESNLFPHIRLDVYTERSGTTYINTVAQRDLETLCKNWLIQLNGLNYKLQWEDKIQTG